MDIELLKLIVPGITAIATLYVGWIIKFTASEEEARGRFKQDVSRLFLFLNNIILIASVLWTVHRLFGLLASPEPITRSVVFQITGYVGTLIFVIMGFLLFYFINRLLALFDRLHDVNQSQGNLNQSQAGIIDKQTEIIKDIYNQIDELKKR